MADDLRMYSVQSLVDEGILEVGDGYRAKNSELSSSGLPFARASNINGGFQFANADCIPFSILERVGAKRSRPGDVVFTSKGTVGRFAYVRHDVQDFVYSPQICYWRSLREERLDSLFLYYWMTSRSFGKQVDAVKGQTDMADYVSLSDQKRMRIALPSISTQRSISRILGSIDRKILNNIEVIRESIGLEANLFTMHQSIGEWGVSEISAVCDIYDGPHATPPLLDCGLIFLGISNLADGVLDLKETNHLSDEDFNKWTRRVSPEAGDVVFSYETRLGQAALIPKRLKCCLGRRMGLLRPRTGDVNSIVLLRAYLSEEFQETIRRRTVHGSTVDRISLKEMGGFPIRLPVGDAMSRLAARLRPFRELVEHNQEENVTLAQLRDLLLPKLMSGEIRVKDAERMVGGVA